MGRSRLQRAATKANHARPTPSPSGDMPPPPPSQLLSARALDNTLPSRNIILSHSSGAPGFVLHAAGLDLPKALLRNTALESQVFQLENDAQNALIVIENYNDQLLSLEEKLQLTQQQLRHSELAASLLRARNSALSRKVCPRAASMHITLAVASSVLKALSCTCGLYACMLGLLPHPLRWIFKLPAFHCCLLGIKLTICYVFLGYMLDQGTASDYPSCSDIKKDSIHGSQVSEASH